MKRALGLAFSLSLLVLIPQARAADEIVVMTQNQYLGADLTAVVTAPDPGTFNLEVIAALQQIAANALPERAVALAGQINAKQPHLVGLQEVFAFGCIDTATPGDGCLDPSISGAFNDHLTATLAALGGYEAAATVLNLNLPALPVDLDFDMIPDIVVSVQDRDVILARSDVSATPVDFTASGIPGICSSPSEDGCNYAVVAIAPSPFGDIPIERGFVAVDVEVADRPYRFVDTHLEVMEPQEGNALSSVIQAAQASELIQTLAVFDNPALNPDDATVIPVGDINSSPDDAPLTGVGVCTGDSSTLCLVDDDCATAGGVCFPVGITILRPYTQFVTGLDFLGIPISAPYTDAWNLRPGRDPGFTCCELADLSNPTSIHDERIDIIFSLDAPHKVKANVLGGEPSDKTRSSRKWPSDHCSVNGELGFGF